MFSPENKVKYLRQLMSKLRLNNITLYVYTHHIFFTHSSVGGHLGYFRVLAIVNSAAMKTGVHVCIFLSFSHKTSYS